MVDTMNEYVSKLLDKLEPLVADLDEKTNELQSKKQKFENVSRLLAYVNGDVNLMGIYADQDLILDSLDKMNSTVDEYKASCYLLQSNDENVKQLPQYREANLFILSLINYFKMNKSELNSDIQKLEVICNEKNIEKKYYDLLNKDNPLISDIDEFTKFMNKHVDENSDKINLLLYVINSNLVNYGQEKN